MREVEQPLEVQVSALEAEITPILKRLSEDEDEDLYFNTQIEYRNFLLAHGYTIGGDDMNKNLNNCYEYHLAIGSTPNFHSIPHMVIRLPKEYSFSEFMKSRVQK